MARPDGPVAVTGAAGYLGGRVASALGDRARALVRAPVRWLPSTSQIVGDLLDDPVGLERSLTGVTTVVHLAGHNEVVAGHDPDRATRETVAMAGSVLRAAQQAGAERIVYVSTVHVYGEHLVAGAEIDEAVPAAPTSPYARARHECEQILASGGLDTVVLRLTNAVGAPADPSVDRWTLVASDLCRQAVLDRTMVLHSAGQQSRDFIALEDACRSVVGAATGGAVPPGTYNLSAGRSSTIRALAELVGDRVEHACGWRPDLQAPAPTGPPDAPYTVRPDRLARCGLRAVTALEDAVDELIDHCLEHRTWFERATGSRSTGAPAAGRT